ncbi:MAG: T9SS type A sorting domain-containing protein [Bacteroidota bacterium]
MRQILLTCLVLASLCAVASAQCSITVNSSNGYQVEIELIPTAIVAPTTCPYGYNFNLEIDYKVTFKGNNIPNQLWKLQGTFGCDNFSNNFFNLPNAPASGKMVTTSNSYNNDTDCATATVESLGCTSFSIDISGPGIPDQIISCNAALALPVELIHFTAQEVDKEVQLTWQTASEINNDYFLVERSVDAKQWEAIDVVQGNGTTDRLSSYETVDASPIATTLYYRLKQVDFDGAFEYSPIEVVNRSSASTTDGIAFPNPTRTSVNIPHEEGSPIQVFDHLGKEVTGAINWSKVNETSMNIDLRGLASGAYYVRAGGVVHRVVKM